MKHWSSLLLIIERVLGCMCACVRGRDVGCKRSLKIRNVFIHVCRKRQILKKRFSVSMAVCYLSC